MEIDFIVIRYGYTKKTGEEAKFKVSLKGPDGESLVLVSNTRNIWAGFPLGKTFSAKIAQPQRTLDQEP